MSQKNVVLLYDITILKRCKLMSTEENRFSDWYLRPSMSASRKITFCGGFFIFFFITHNASNVRLNRIKHRLIYRWIVKKKKNTRGYQVRCIIVRTGLRRCNEKPVRHARSIRVKRRAFSVLSFVRCLQQLIVRTVWEKGVKSDKKLNIIVVFFFLFF